MTVKLVLFTRWPLDIGAPRGGVETVALALTRALASLPDMEVHVLTLEKTRRDVHVFEELGATIHRLPGSGWPQMLDVIRGPGRSRLRKYILDLAPDVVHSHETYGLGLDPLPVPHVFTVHGFDHANIPTERRPLAWLRAPLWRRVEAWGLARQHYIISITPYVRQHITPLTRARIFDIDNPIDPACFEVRRSEVSGRVFFAGWISHRKNPLTLVRAFARVVDRGIDATLHLAGEEKDPRYSAELRAAVETSGVSDRVRLLGRVAPDEIRRQLGAASVFVLPARQENAPMAISEALAAGVPVIASNRCGMPFMVDEGKTGFLVEPDDVHGLADRIALVLQNGQLRAATDPQDAPGPGEPGPPLPPHHPRGGRHLRGTALPPRACGTVRRP